MPAKDFRYHLLSIGVNREANGATVRSAERDAFGISWTFAQLGYWRADRNRCLTGAQASASAIEGHLAHCAGLENLDADTAGERMRAGNHAVGGDHR